MENKILRFLQDLLPAHGLRLYHWVTFSRKGTMHVEIFIEKANAMQLYAQFTGKNFMDLGSMLAAQERVTIEDCERINNDVLNFVEKENYDFSIHIQVSSPGMFRRIKRPIEFLYLHHYLTRIKMKNGSLSGGDRGFAVDLFNPQNTQFPLALLNLTNSFSDSSSIMESENEKYPLNCALVQEKWGVDLDKDWTEYFTNSLLSAETKEEISLQLVFVSFPIHEKWEEKWQNLYNLLMVFWQEKASEIFKQQKQRDLNNIWQEYLKESDLHKKSKGKFLITQGSKLIWNLLSLQDMKEIHLDFITEKK